MTRIPLAAALAMASISPGLVNPIYTRVPTPTKWHPRAQYPRHMRKAISNRRAANKRAAQARRRNR